MPVYATVKWLPFRLDFLIHLFPSPAGWGYVQLDSYPKIEGKEELVHKEQL